MDPLFHTIDPDVGAAVMQPWTWIFALSLFVAFFQGGTMGANDVANNFGTSVGSKVLSVNMASVFSAIFITAGAMSIGSEVAKTVGKGIVDYKKFADEPQLFMLGMFCASLATGLFVALATALSLPVSTTHSIVGSVLGFGLVEFGGSGIQWGEVTQIVISWIVSPLTSGLVASILYLSAKFLILKPAQDESMVQKCMARQKFYMTAVIFMIVVLLVVFISFKYQKSKVGMNLGLSFGIGAGMAIIGYLFLIDLMNKFYDNRELSGGLETDPHYLNDMDSLADLKDAGGDVSAVLSKQELSIRSSANLRVDEGYIEASSSLLEIGATDAHRSIGGVAESGSTAGGNRQRHTKTSLFTAKIANKLGALGNNNEKKKDVAPDDIWNPIIEKRFAFGQLMSACFEAFSAGANDISNAAGTLIAVYQTLLTGNVNGKPAPEYWALAYTCIGIVVGLSIWGYKVMATIGKNITIVTPSRGLAAELGTATAVLIASFIGLPVSTTHCSVGAVIFVGLCETQGWRKVNYGLILKIIASWVFTLPIACGISAGFYAALRPAVTSQGFVPPHDLLLTSNYEYQTACNGTLDVRYCAYFFRNATA